MKKFQLLLGLAASAAIILAAVIVARAATPPTFPLKITVVSGLTDTGKKNPTTSCPYEIWKGTVGLSVILKASGGMPPYQWKIPGGGPATGPSTTFKLKQGGCLGLMDSSNLRTGISIQAIPPGPPAPTK